MSAEALACPVQALRLTVLVENTAAGRGLVPEHGFAALLETERGRVLFDTGASGRALAGNAAALGVALAGLDAIVLSHGHYDHTGGLAAALAAAPKARVHFHWRCTADRWARRFGFRKAIGMPQESRRALDRAQRQPVAGPTVLEEGVLLSGPVPGPPSPAQRGFLMDSDGGPAPDAFEDEVFLLARTPEGWVLVTGCCHRGPGNTLAWARHLAGEEPIAAVVGGLHLKRLGRAAWDEAASALREAGVREVLAGHCTGEAALAHLAARLGQGVRPLRVGLAWAWPHPPGADRAAASENA
jgi:7,8-dihydropterin-6-yl-methyl-4-(beta-D-ribofuranosyl)aminobenzene 5'-phosphate synthase